jgi:hypothetical protein
MKSPSPFVTDSPRNFMRAAASFLMHGLIKVNEACTPNLMLEVASVPKTVYYRRDRKTPLAKPRDSLLSDTLLTQRKF